MTAEVMCYDWSEFDKLMTIKYTPSKFSQFFGAKEEVIDYVGNCTVWHEKKGKMLSRCDTRTECLLSDFYHSIEYDESKHP